MNRPPFSVVVSSCDAYADLWAPFFHLLFKYWPEVPTPVYLISNHKRFDDPRVQTIALKADHHWATNTLEALTRIGAPSILYLQEDYYLSGPANAAAIAELHARHLASGATATSLFNREATGRAVAGHGLIECGPENEWVFDFQAAFWNLPKVTALIERGWTPWHAEGEMNRRAREIGTGFYSVTAGHAPVLPYLQVIRGGLWLPEGRDLCAAHGIRPDFRRRPCAAFQAGFLNRWQRSFLKRRSRWYKKRHPLAETVVAPLPDAGA